MHRAKSTPVVSRIEQIRVLVLSNIFSNLYQSVDTSMIEYNKLESVFGWSIFTLFIKKVVICLFVLSSFLFILFCNNIFYGPPQRVFILFMIIYFWTTTTDLSQVSSYTILYITYIVLPPVKLYKNAAALNNSLKGRRGGYV
jgi:hypothetical protein